MARADSELGVGDVHVYLQENVSADSRRAVLKKVLIWS